MHYIIDCDELDEKEQVTTTNEAADFVTFLLNHGFHYDSIKVTDQIGRQLKIKITLE